MGIYIRLKFDENEKIQKAINVRVDTDPFERHVIGARDVSIKY